MQRRIVRHCYQIQFRGGRKFVQGIGDFFRGCFFIWELAQELDLEPRIYFGNHPTLKHFLVSSEDIVVNPDSVTYHDIFNKQQLQNLLTSKSGDINLFTNACWTYDLNNLKEFPDECKTFVRNNIRMTDWFRDSFEKLNIPDRYSVIQIRLGDPVMPREISSELYQQILNIIDGNVNKDCPIYVTSDNTLIRNRLAEKYSFQTLGLPICHIGDPHAASNVDSMMGTMTELFLLSKATQIYQMSVYWWPSGFSTWISQIYGIPIRNFKLDT